MARRSSLRSIDGQEAAAKKQRSWPEGYAPSPHDAPADERLTSSALGRALAVLETLVETDRSLGLQEIANRLDLPRQSAHRILNQLIDLGLLQRHIDRDRFLPGPRMRWLALETLYQSHSSGPWHAILEDLADTTQETCNIGVLDKNKVLLVDRVESKWALRVHSQVGRRLEPHSSAIGRLLLAHLPKKRRHELIGIKPLKRFTPFTIVDEDELEREFVTIRRQGYSLSNQATTPGIFAIAVPICDPQGRVVAGLACQAPLVRMSPDRATTEALPPLREAARRMEALLTLDREAGSAASVTERVKKRRGKSAKPPPSAGKARARRRA
ncbi:MAG TPA: IclR family transcriptional regulator [Kiloniellales bacterium]|nr:IclR family transcriptional regulator [Kiloniellales bacterium]